MYNFDIGKCIGNRQKMLIMFLWMQSNIHLANNDSDKSDTCENVWPLSSGLNASSKKHHTADEAVVPYLGRPGVNNSYEGNWSIMAVTLIWSNLPEIHFMDTAILRTEYHDKQWWKGLVWALLWFGSTSSVLISQLKVHTGSIREKRTMKCCWYTCTYVRARARTHAHTHTHTHTHTQTRNVALSNFTRAEYHCLKMPRDTKCWYEHQWGMQMLLYNPNKCWLMPSDIYNSQLCQ
jgi:hypothetical protein